MSRDTGDVFGEHFSLLARNNRLANVRLHRACAALDDATYRADLGGFFASIHATLNHILLVDRRYLERLAGGVVPWGGREEELYPALADLGAAQAAVDDEYIALCDGLDGAGLARSARWQDDTGEAFADPVHRVLAHVFLHAVHHRGQVHDLLSRAGAAPPQLDEFFLSLDAQHVAAELAELGID